MIFNPFKSLFGQKDSDNLSEIIQNGAYLVDVRTPSEFASGHVQGSTNIPLDSIEANLNAFKGKNHIVVFCRSGMRSSQAKKVLEQNGFANVSNGGTWKNVEALIQK